MFTYARVLSAFFLSLAAFLAIEFSNSAAFAAVDDPSKPKIVFSQALKLLKTRQFNSAIKNFTQIIDSKSTDAKLQGLALYNRGLAYQGLGQLKKARNDYSLAIKLGTLSDSTLKVVYYNRGLVHDGLKRPTAALADFTSAIEKNPRFSPAYHNLGNVLRKMGRNKRAIKNFLKSLELGNPQPYLTYMGLALAYEGIDRKKEAITSLKYALDIRPRFKKASDMLARLTTENLYSFSAVTPPLIDDSPAITGSIPPTVMRKNLRNENTRPVQNNNSQYLGLRGVVEVEDKPVRYKKLALRGTLTSSTNGRVALIVPGPGLKRAQRASRSSLSSTKKPKHRTYKVQLGTSKTSASANKIWFFLRAQNEDLLKSLKPTFQRVKLNKGGILYRIQVGPFKSRQAAKRLCTAIEKRAVNCFPVESRI